MSSPEVAFPPVVYVPTSAADDEGQARLEMVELVDGRRALFAYSAMDRLMSLYRSDAPWVLLTVADLRWPGPTPNSMAASAPPRRTDGEDVPGFHGTRDILAGAAVGLGKAIANLHTVDDRDAFAAAATTGWARAFHYGKRILFGRAY